MFETTYARAGSVAEAVKLNKAAKGDGKYLAGGHTLIPAMKARLASPSVLVDVARIAGLSGVKVAGKKVTIGAATTHAEVAANEKLMAVCPALCHLAGHIGDQHVRHRGTIGGSIANNDPAADYPAALLALDATIVTDKREIPAEKYFKGLFETSLKDGELVTAVTFTAPAKAGYAKFPNPASRYAMTGVFVAAQKDGPRVTVTGAGDDGVFRSKELEAAIGKGLDASKIDAAKVPSKNLMSDLHASADYRAALIKAMAKRATAMANG